MVLFFIGPPGIGKGTQASYLSKFYHFSVGTFLRQTASANEQAILASGGMISFATVLDRIDKTIFDQNLIFDGFPRTKEQAIIFDEYNQSRDHKISYIVIEFTMNPEALSERILSRKLCKKCDFSNANISLFCSKCNFFEFYFREDDNKKIFDKRMAAYQENSKAIKEYYLNNDVKYIIFHASGSEPDVQARLSSLIQNLP